MFPTVGVYLKELYPEQADTGDGAETRSVRRRYFQRRSMAQEDEGADRKSIAPPRKSSEDVTRIFSSLSTVFDFADFASTQEKVSTESEDFLSLIQRVRHDVTEASRLYTSQAVTHYLDSWPDKRTWIDKILIDIQRTLNDIGLYMETVRVSGDDGGAAGLRRRFEWILSHQKKFISKQQTLMVCHSSLMAAVQMMQTAEMNAAFSGQDPVFEAPARPWIRDDGTDVMRSPHSRQKWRLSQRNLSLPSITVSEAERDKNDGDSINSTPAELPGSTPDDMPDPQNWDLYAMPQKPRRLSLDAADAVLASQVSSQPPVRQRGALGTQMRLPYSKPVLQRPPSDPLPARRSFDQLRSGPSSTQDQSRNSLDSHRPRAYSDQVLPRRSADLKTHGWTEQPRPLPTLKEKPLERYDSTASVSIADASTIPLTAMRHRPKAVQVRKPPPKHRSLPSKLPAFSSQTSLMEDLSRWVLPASARESYQSSQSTDTNMSLDTTSPLTSAGSSPILPSPTSSSIIARKTSLKSNTPTMPPNPPPTVRQSIADTEVSNSGEPQQRLSGKEESSTASGDPSALLRRFSSNATQGGDNGRTKAPMTVAVPEPTPSCDLPTPLVSKEQTSEQAINPESQTAPLRPDPDISQKEASMAKTLEPVGKVITANASPQEPSASSPSPQHKIARKPLPVPPAQPMTALAKRRAAHARRMQLAFGEG